MTIKAFYSFHYIPDNWRAGTVRGIGKLDGNAPVSDNSWETITSGGDAAIKKWIGDEMKGKEALVVLIGKNTAGRKWINYEIQTAWDAGLGVFGIYVHNLLDSAGEQTTKGSNPFDYFSFGSAAKAHDSAYTSSKYVYDDIATNIDSWAQAAIDAR